MQNDILFDNIYIGHSAADAEALQKETFDVKVKVEKAEEEATKPKQDEKKEIKSPMDLVFTDDPVLYVREKFDLFLTIAKRDPIEAVKFVPEVAGGLAVLAVTVLVLLMGVVGGGAAAAPSKEEMKAKADKAKSKATEVKDSVVEGVSSSAQAVQAETKQRSGRTSAQ